MKFGKSLSNQIEETLPEWRDKFLSYKELKKRLKLINPPFAADESTRPEKRRRFSAGDDCFDARDHMSGEEIDFLNLLEDELEKLNSFFVEKEEEYIIRLKDLRDRVASAKDWSEEMIDIRKEIVDFHGEMVLLENYSSINYTEGQGGLKTRFYSSSCPDAEAIVRSSVEHYFNDDPSIAAGLLRLHFHDCFVQGCDGSVLIKGASAERNGIANRGARGFEVIDYAKSQIEASCPGVVSCADILALAARDSVDLSDGPSWNVPLGRRDGRISLASQVSNLPSPFDSVAAQRQKFADKGLDDEDLVTLVGAHTIGQTHCQFTSYRLYNFTKTGNADPTISPSFLPKFQNICPANGDGSKAVDLDIESQQKFDVSFFKNVRDGNAVLESDQRLWGDSVTQKIVNNYAGNFKGLLGLRFAHEFQKAMIKMSSIEVKTGTEGEIRKICSRFNY